MPSLGRHGRQTGDGAQKGRSTVSIEVRSVNGRFLDLALRLPDELRALEPALRELLGAGFRRGKIELRANTGREADTAWPQPERRAAQPTDTGWTCWCQDWLPKARALSVNEVLQWCRGAPASERLDEHALAAARRCIDGLRDAREREGARLVDVLLDKRRPAARTGRGCRAAGAGGGAASAAAFPGTLAAKRSTAPARPRRWARTT